MRHVLVALLIAGCGGSTATPEVAREPAPEVEPATEPPPPGAVKTASFTSPALGVDKTYLVYLPGGYSESEARYPVIYLLHGLGGDETNWTRHGGLTEAADALGLQAIVVMPDGDDSFYANWVTDVDYEACLRGRRQFGRAADMTTYCVREARYEDYIVNDLIAHVDQTYRTIPERRARAIGGLSMGGFGALMLAMRHEDVFASTASHAGVAALLYAGPFPYERGEVELTEDPREWLKTAGRFGELFAQIFGENIEVWRAHDPAFMANRLDDGDLAIYIDCGTEDEFRLHNGAAYLHEVLDERGVKHVFELLPGHHNAQFWRERIDDSLRFHVEQFERAGVARPRSAVHTHM